LSNLIKLGIIKHKLNITLEFQMKEIEATVLRN